MPTNAENLKEVRIAVPFDVWEKLDEMRGDNAVRTMQNMLAPVICAFSRGEIRQVYEQGAKAA